MGKTPARRAASAPPHPESAELFRQVTEAIREVFWVSDIAKNDIVYISPGYEEIWGRTCESLLRSPRDWLDAIHPEDRERVLNSAVTKQAAGLYDETYRVVRSDGALRWIRDRAFPVKDGSGKVYRIAGIAEDITREVEAARALSQAETDLRHAQKLEAVGRLAGGIAHDFNNLLTVILGSADLLGDLPGLNAAARQETRVIRRTAERAAQLTRRLLAFGRKEVARPRPLDIRRELEEFRRTITRLIGEDISVTLTHRGRRRFVLADPDQIEQILLNLALNARDAMPNGGRFLLSLRDAAPEELPEAKSGALVISARDTGPGLTPDARAHLFEPFFTTKANGQGTGLGLSTVFAIVTQLGGRIWVDEAGKMGGAFHIALPAVPAVKGKNGISAPRRAERTLRPSSALVLVVEDEDKLRALTVRILKREGYRVLSAESGSTALRLFGSSRRSVDLLLTDLVMPGLSGREISEALTTQRPGLKTLYMSGYTNDELVRRGAAGGDYLAKPFRAPQLIRRVKETLAR